MNTFRTFMLMGGVMIAGIFFAMFFTYPMIQTDAAGVRAYEALTGESLPSNTRKFTLYQAAQYTLEGGVRGKRIEY